MKSSRPDLPALQAVTLVVPDLAADGRAALEARVRAGACWLRPPTWRVPWATSHRMS